MASLSSKSKTLATKVATAMRSSYAVQDCDIDVKFLPLAIILHIFEGGKSVDEAFCEYYRPAGNSFFPEEIVAFAYRHFLDELKGCALEDVVEVPSLAIDTPITFRTCHWLELFGNCISVARKSQTTINLVGNLTFRTESYANEHILRMLCMDKERLSRISHGWDLYHALDRLYHAYPLSFVARGFRYRFPDKLLTAMSDGDCTSGAFYFNLDVAAALKSRNSCEGFDSITIDDCLLCVSLDGNREPFSVRIPDSVTVPPSFYVSKNFNVAWESRFSFCNAAEVIRGIDELLDTFIYPEYVIDPDALPYLLEDGDDPNTVFHAASRKSSGVKLVEHLIKSGFIPKGKCQAMDGAVIISILENLDFSICDDEFIRTFLIQAIDTNALPKKSLRRVLNVVFQKEGYWNMEGQIHALCMMAMVDFKLAYDIYRASGLGINQIIPKIGTPFMILTSRAKTMNDLGALMSLNGDFNLTYEGISAVSIAAKTNKAIHDVIASHLLRVSLSTITVNHGADRQTDINL